MSFLILVVIIVFRIGKEQIAVAKYEAKHRQKTLYTNTWKTRVTNPGLEQELKLFIGRPENNLLLLEEVNEAYNSIFDGKRVDELFPRSKWCKREKNWTPEYHEQVQNHICRYDSINALRIILAKRGYIPTSDADSMNRLSAPSLLDRHVLFWCDKKLREQGAPITLGFTETGNLKWEVLMR